MAQNTTKTTEKSAPAAVGENFDMAEFNRLIARAKAEMGVFVGDAQKKRPLFSKTQEQAVAKRDSIVKSFESFFDLLDAIKREG